MSGGRVELGLGGGWYDGGARGVRDPVPADRHPLRDARGPARDPHRHVGDAGRRAVRLHGPAAPRSSTPPRCRSRCSADAADHHRRLRRQAHAAPRRAVRRRVQPAVPARSTTTGPRATSSAPRARRPDAIPASMRYTVAVVAVRRPRRGRVRRDAPRRSAARPTTCARTRPADSSTKSSNACARSARRAPKPSTCKCSTSTTSITCDSSRPRSRPTSEEELRGRPLRSARRSAEHEHRRAARTVAPHRGARLRLDLDLGPLLRGRQHRQPALPRSDHVARRARGDDRTRAVRFARLLGGLPPPGGARQRDRDARPDRRRSRRARARRRLAAAGVRRLRHPLRHARRTAAHAQRVHPVRARAAHAGAHDVRRASSSRCATRSANRSRCRSGCRSGSAAAARR